MTDVQQPTIGDLVVANPAAARILDGFGLDYCCHGELSLEAACATAEVDPALVEAALAGLEVEGDATWSTLSPAALAEHIVTTHHRYLWEELPLLDALAAKVLTVHGARHPELAEVHSLVAAVRAELEPHLLEEERVLFPSISARADERGDLAPGIADPIRAMLGEHDRAGELLARLRTVTGAYTPPEDGCASYRSRYERLATLELDTHVHIHKENHVLFPAVLELAAATTDV